MNIAQVISARTRHVDPDRVRRLQGTELGCGSSLAELLTSKRASTRTHERALAPGQGKHPADAR